MAIQLSLLRITLEHQMYRTNPHSKKESPAFIVRLDCSNFFNLRAKHHKNIPVGYFSVSIWIYFSKNTGLVQQNPFHRLSHSYSPGSGHHRSHWEAVYFRTAVSRWTPATPQHSAPASVNLMKEESADAWKRKTHKGGSSGTLRKTSGIATSSSLS